MTEDEVEDLLPMSPPIGTISNGSRGHWLLDHVENSHCLQCRHRRTKDYGNGPENACAVFTFIALEGEAPLWYVTTVGVSCALFEHRRQKTPLPCRGQLSLFETPKLCNRCERPVDRCTRRCRTLRKFWRNATKAIAEVHEHWRRTASTTARSATPDRADDSTVASR